MSQETALTQYTAEHHQILTANDSGGRWITWSVRTLSNAERELVDAGLLEDGGWSPRTSTFALRTTAAGRSLLVAVQTAQRDEL